MITTRRSNGYTNEAFRVENSNVATLEREVPKSYAEYTATAVPEHEDESVARERMSRNLDFLMNYEKYLEDSVAVEEAPVAEEVAETVVMTATSEDITPTSTTMQFGDAGIDEIYSDMQSERTTAKYKLNTKGKVLIAFYATVVTIIMALIIINTTVLASLKSANASKQAELNDVYTRYQELEEEMKQISSDENVIEVAQREYNMIKK